MHVDDLQCMYLFYKNETLSDKYWNRKRLFNNILCQFISNLILKKLKIHYDISKPNGVLRKVMDVSLAKNMAGHQK